MSSGDSEGTPAIVDQHAVGSERWKREVEGPFRRLDANPDTFELCRLALCAVTIVPLRILIIALFLLAYYLTARCFLVFAPDKPWAHAVNIYGIRKASWLMLIFLGYWRVDVKGKKENAGRKGEPRVFVSNHISYVEILYFLAELGPSFVMKRTCLRVPLIGSIATRVLDSVSVDNKGGKQGGSGSEAIAARLVRMFGEDAIATGDAGRGNGDLSAAAKQSWERGWRGNPLLLFPEGTTSNGSCLLRFKTGVFAGGMPVYPVVVTYDVRRFSPAFESILFSVHTFRMLAEPASILHVEYLPRYCPTPEQRADRTLYAKAVQRIFCEATGLPAFDSGYAEKTRYHQYLMKHFKAHPWGSMAFLLPAPDRQNKASLACNGGNQCNGGQDLAVNRRAANGGVAAVEVEGREETVEGLPGPSSERGDDGNFSSREIGLPSAAVGADEGGNGLRKRKQESAGGRSSSVNGQPILS